MECLIALGLAALAIGCLIKLITRYKRKRQEKKQSQVTDEAVSVAKKRSFQAGVDTSSGIGEDSLLRAIRAEDWDSATQLAQCPLTVLPGEVSVPTEVGKLRFRLYGEDMVNITLRGTRGGMKLAIDLPLSVLFEVVNTLVN